MSETTCRVLGCDAPISVKKRELCKRHYHAAWRNGTLEGVRIWRHSITSHDAASMTGECSTCGPDTPVYRRHDRIACLPARRESKTKHKHGLDQATLDALLLASGRACAICSTLFSADLPYCIDHDHACCPGETSCGSCVRGLLCRTCNVGIGMLGDSTERVAAALLYLSRTKLHSIQDAE